MHGSTAKRKVVKENGDCMQTERVVDTLETEAVDSVVAASDSDIVKMETENDETLYNDTLSKYSDTVSQDNQCLKIFNSIIY